MNTQQSPQDPQAPVAQTPQPMVVTIDQALARVQDMDGLTLPQRMWLAARLRYGSDAECSAAAGVDVTTPAHWKRGALFADTYRELITAGVTAQVERTRTELQRLVTLIPATLAEMLVAEETIPAGKNGETITRPAWNARGKAVELVYRPLGLWQPDAPQSAPSEGAALFGEMAAILKLRREEMEAQRLQRQSDASIIEGTATETGGSGQGNA